MPLSQRTLFEAAISASNIPATERRKKSLPRIRAPQPEDSPYLEEPNQAVEATAVRGCRCVLSLCFLCAHCGASPFVLCLESNSLRELRIVLRLHRLCAFQRLDSVCCGVRHHIRKTFDSAFRAREHVSIRHFYRPMPRCCGGQVPSDTEIANVVVHLSDLRITNRLRQRGSRRVSGLPCSVLSFK